MLNKISWISFGTALVLIVTIYYLYVLFVYFRKDIFAAGTFNIKTFHGSRQQMRTINSGGAKVASQDVIQNSDDDSFTMVHELLEDLKILLDHASGSKMIREELLQAIRSKLKFYPGIAGTDLVTDIDEHLMMEVKDKCGQELTPEDLKLIWS